MIALDPPFRPATIHDAPVLARLTDMAGEGLPTVFWTGMAEEGQAPLAVGTGRMVAQVESGRTIVVADEGSGPVAALFGYAIGAEAEPLEGLSPVIRPLQALENEALSSFYVNVLATLPEARGHGLGARLVAIAEAIARAEGLSRVSIIVADNNAGARRLYARLGYREAARRPMVKDGWRTEGRDWVLLLKDIDQRPDRMPDA